MLELLKIVALLCQVTGSSSDSVVAHQAQCHTFYAECLVQNYGDPSHYHTDSPGRLRACMVEAAKNGKVKY